MAAEAVDGTGAMVEAAPREADTLYFVSTRLYDRFASQSEATIHMTLGT